MDARPHVRYLQGGAEAVEGMVVDSAPNRRHVGVVGDQRHREEREDGGVEAVGLAPHRAARPSTLTRTAGGRARPSALRRRSRAEATRGGRSSVWRRLDQAATCALSLAMRAL